MVPFLGLFFGSIFDLFLDAALLVRDVFYGTFSMSMVVFGPFLDVFWTVHFISDATCAVSMKLGFRSPCLACLGSIIHNGRGGLHSEAQ